MLTLEEIVKIIKKTTRPLRHRVNNMVLFARLLMINGNKTPSTQVESANNEVLDNVKYYQDYGFASCPPKDSQAILIKVQGNPANVVAVKIANRELRFKGLKSGEVAISDDSGCYIHLKNGGCMDVSAPEIVSIKAKTVNASADKAIVDAKETITTGKTKLANGGIGVALLGCTVEVDPNTHKGFITSASAEVTAK